MLACKVSQLSRDACAPHVTGARAADPNNSRDWVLTTVWALSMDAVALGLLALPSGTVACGWFVIGLRWL